MKSFETTDMSGDRISVGIGPFYGHINVSINGQQPVRLTRDQTRQLINGLRRAITAAWHEDQSNGPIQTSRR
jgi:L-lysine 2,3-aminomutase